MKKSDLDWKQALTKEEYKILREKGTEPAFTGKLLKNKQKGTYSCAGCGNKLFSSDTKFDSGSGWPSFFDVLKKGDLKLEKEKGLFKRIEIMCSKCGGHLGHVFEDGPKPTGKRYCVNSLSLKFEKE